MDAFFEKGKGDWEKLADFMDENNFSCADYLACICAHLLNLQDKTFYTKIMVQGEEFSIAIMKGKTK